MTPGAGSIAAEPRPIQTDLTRLFAPRSVALVGATDHPTNFGGRVFRAMLKFGYPGKVYPVNPRLKEIYGLTCYPGIRDVPDVPERLTRMSGSQRRVPMSSAAHRRSSRS